MRWILAAALSGSIVAACHAQQPMGNMHNMADMEPLLPPEQLPPPIRMTGIGNAHIAITALPEAQAWFDQGLNLLHDFWDYESTKAFEQSVRVDPNCAMCWWGLAEAVGVGHSPRHVYAEHALAEAVRLNSHATAIEQLYIEAALAEAAIKNGGKHGANKQEIAILRRLVSKAPSDPEARLFLGITLEDGYDDKGEPKRGEQEGIAILEGILRDVPNDSATNHYWIHAIEPSNHPEQALKSAALLASLAPTSGHMVHMPGHIYYRVGDYAEAEHWFTASMQADERYMHEQNVGPDDDWNYVHNMMYAIANLMEQGRLADANALSDHLAAAQGRLSASLYIWSARDQMARISRRLPVALRVGDWETVLALTGSANLPNAPKTSNLRFFAAELSHYAAGMKALEQNDVASAQAASARLDAGLEQAKQGQAAHDAEAKQKDESKDAKPPMVAVMPDALPGPVIKSLEIESLELRAGVLVAQGKLKAAKKLYADAARKEKKIGYHEPPFYIRPVGETEGAALLKAKDFAGARAAYESALVQRPNSGFGLYGLARVKELSGDTAGAREGYQAFLKQWAAADAGLPEVEHARKALAGNTEASR